MMYYRGNLTVNEDFLNEKIDDVKAKEINEEIVEALTKGRDIVHYLQEEYLVTMIRNNMEDKNILKMYKEMDLSPRNLSFLTNAFHKTENQICEEKILGLLKDINVDVNLLKDFNKFDGMDLYISLNTVSHYPKSKIVAMNINREQNYMSLSNIVLKLKDVFDKMHVFDSKQEKYYFSLLCRLCRHNRLAGELYSALLSPIFQNTHIVYSKFTLQNFAIYMENNMTKEIFINFLMLKDMLGKQGDPKDAQISQEGQEKRLKNMFREVFDNKFFDDLLKDNEELMLVKMEYELSTEKSYSIFDK